MSDLTKETDLCWCVDEGEKVVCDHFEDNDRGECIICGHRKECHDNP